MLATRLFKLLFDRLGSVGAFKQRARPLILWLDQKAFVQISSGAFVFACTSRLHNSSAAEGILRYDFASLRLCSSFVSILVLNHNSFLVCLDLLIPEAEALLTRGSDRALLRRLLLLSLLEGRRLECVAANAEL